MSWRYAGAVIYGDKVDPQPGQYVVITLEDAAADPVEMRELTWTFDGTQTKAQFVTMVKGEVAAHVAHLNGGAAADDVTDVFEP